MKPHAFDTLSKDAFYGNDKNVTSTQCFTRMFSVVRRETDVVPRKLIDTEKQTLAMFLLGNAVDFIQT